MEYWHKKKIKDILKQNCHCTYECIKLQYFINWRYQPSLVRSIIKNSLMSKINIIIPSIGDSGY